jgi:hypothetical protein
MTSRLQPIGKPWRWPKPIVLFIAKRIWLWGTRISVSAILSKPPRSINC